MNTPPNLAGDERESLTGPSLCFQPYDYYGLFRAANRDDSVYAAAAPVSSGFRPWLPPQTDKSAAAEGNSHRDFQALSLTVSPSPEPAPLVAADVRKRTAAVEKSGEVKEIVARKSIDTFGQRTSQYRGVTRHRWTGRYEAHLWDNSSRKEGQTRKGRQVYLGGYDKEEKAARAYDLAALKYWGATTHINFPISTYEKELEEMKNMSRQEFVAHLRRKSSGFSRGASMYRGVTRHHQHGRWQARIGRVAGNKDLYLGTFSTQEEAAEAYDIAAIKFRGTSAVTNFNITRYDVKRICLSSTLIAGDLAKRSPKHSVGPSSLDDSASPVSPQAFLPGESNSDELADAMWKTGSDERDRAPHGDSVRSGRGPSSRGSSGPSSPKGPTRMGEEFGERGGCSGRAYFSLDGQRYEEGADGADSGRLFGMIEKDGEMSFRKI